MSAFREADIVEITIRPDIVIRIHGIPYDLTKAEAERVAAVVLAFGNQTRERRS